MKEHANLSHPESTHIISPEYIGSLRMGDPCRLVLLPSSDYDVTEFHIYSIVFELDTVYPLELCHLGDNHLNVTSYDSTGAMTSQQYLCGDVTIDLTIVASRLELVLSRGSDTSRGFDLVVVATNTTHNDSGTSTLVFNDASSVNRRFYVP